MINSAARVSTAVSLEHDILRSVLDHDAVPHILTMAAANWAVSQETAWAALTHQFSLGRLAAYRQIDETPVDLSALPLESVRDDFLLIVEPTEDTLRRIDDLDGH